MYLFNNPTTRFLCIQTSKEIVRKVSYLCLQIADFGMARDVSDDTYYVSSGGKIPVKWTAPEVSLMLSILI